jgi:hypothetical protein
MANFSDINGRNWQVNLNVHTIKQIKQILNVDLLDEKAHEVLQRIAEDVCLSVDVLYLALKEQLDTANISDEEFGKSLGGDCLNEAVGALVQALINFYPNPQKREFLKRLWEKSTKHMDKTNQEMLNMLEDVRVEETIAKRMEEAKEQGIQNAISGLSYTESPDSSESTPATSPSVSSPG